MSLRSNARAKGRKNRYKVSVYAKEGRRRREYNMVQIRKEKREEILQKKRRERLTSAASTAEKKFLQRDDDPSLQFEAACALTKIAPGTSDHTKVVIDDGAVKLLESPDAYVREQVKLLESPDAYVREQAVCALGNIAVDSPKCRDLVLGQDALIPLLSQLNEHAKPSMLLNATWTLLVLLQNAEQRVKKGASTALGSVADSFQDHFQKHYDTVMPCLKAIHNGTPNRMLRAKSMECISLVGMAVGKDRFIDDAKQVLDAFKSLQPSLQDTDDPTSCMMQALARFCKCLGKDFFPYAEFVIPPLLRSAKPALVTTTSDLDKAAAACNILCCYAGYLKEQFIHWLFETDEILLPLLECYNHKGVQKAAVSAMPKLLCSSTLGIEKGEFKGRSESDIKAYFDRIISALLKALRKETDTEISSIMLDAIKKCVQICWRLLDQYQVPSIFAELKHTMSEELVDKVGDCLVVLREALEGKFFPFFDELLASLPTSQQDRLRLLIKEQD